MTRLHPEEKKKRAEARAEEQKKRAEARAEARAEEQKKRAEAYAEEREEHIRRLVDAAPPFSPRQEAIIRAAFAVPSPGTPPVTAPSPSRPAATT